MVRRIFTWLFPGSDYEPDAWGTSRSPLASTTIGSIVGIILLLLVLSVLIVFLFPA